jgi:hypothetical protein
MKKGCGSLAVIAFLLIISAPTLTNAQPDMPYDLLITMAEVYGSDEPTEANLLERVDGRTFETSLFFEDDTARLLLPLSWSPDGNLLAVLFYPDLDFPVQPQLCILTREGVLQTCLEDLPPRDPGVLHDGLYAVTWSNDSQNIYFLSDLDRTGELITRGLMEADVTTGKTLRVIFESTFKEYRDLIINWASDLSYALIGVGGFESAVSHSGQLLNLETLEAVSIGTFFPSDVHLTRVCPGFSPSGTYFAVTTGIKKEGFQRYIYQFRLVDTNGRETVVLDENSFHSPLWGVGCPIWQKDEEAFFFIATTYDAPLTETLGPAPRIFKYTLETANLDVYFDHSSVEGIRSDMSLKLSPDGDHIAFESMYMIQNGSRYEVKSKFSCKNGGMSQVVTGITAGDSSSMPKRWRS